MAQLDPLQKISQTSKTPKSNSPTFEQLLQGNERSWSTNTSPTAYDQEEYTPTHGKKSVITKVKEKAKKLKYSLSGKKKLHENDVHNHDDNSTPSWGPTLDDEDEEEEEDEDPEYLGAPMYESELAPEAYKEAARQHPRADPVVSEKHAVPTSIKHEFIEQDNMEKLPDSPSKTITETVTEKLAPAYAAVSDATHAIASKISGLTLTNSNEQESGNEQAAPKTGHFAESNVNASGISSPGKWDKGVSVKEYFVEKFEPGEGERSLSQIITEAMSPRQAASGDKGIVEKMKGAVTSFIRPDDSPKSTENSIKSSSAPNNPISTNATLSPKCPSLSSKNIVISTNDNLLQDNPIAMPHKSPISTTNETAASLSHFPEFHSASSSPLN
ncbi:PREDICTED: uncharacterized protein LOC109221643 [Nicotiana attenuata]|uniref:Low-temperature-induced 65 kDa protein n=2 Tax=Nicotiana attenuata TaxID=49451 RepID=A0A1J6KIZ3_NICAT|nr:PREDICTED: uncharacterized protein LOC109221643 [Nicotiana attenuata]OIT19273.1 hypothetical protein A4A49_42296 [Nicotiana attenuata]